MSVGPNPALVNDSLCAAFCRVTDENDTPQNLWILGRVQMLDQERTRYVIEDAEKLVEWDRPSLCYMVSPENREPGTRYGVSYAQIVPYPEVSQPLKHGEVVACLYGDGSTFYRARVTGSFPKGARFVRVQFDGENKAVDVYRSSVVHIPRHEHFLPKIDEEYPLESESKAGKARTASSKDAGRAKRNKDDD